MVLMGTQSADFTTRHAAEVQLTQLSVQHGFGLALLEVCHIFVFHHEKRPTPGSGVAHMVVATIYCYLNESCETLLYILENILCIIRVPSKGGTSQAAYMTGLDGALWRVVLGQ